MPFKDLEIGQTHLDPKEEINGRFREEYKKAYKDILSDEIINEGNKWFEYFLDTAYEEGVKQGKLQE